MNCPITITSCPVCSCPLPTLMCTVPSQLVPGLPPGPMPTILTHKSGFYICWSLFPEHFFLSHIAWITPTHPSDLSTSITSLEKFFLTFFWLSKNTANTIVEFYSTASSQYPSLGDFIWLMSLFSPLQYRLHVGSNCVCFLDFILSSDIVSRHSASFLTSVHSFNKYSSYLYYKWKCLNSKHIINIYVYMHLY